VKNPNAVQHGQIHWHDIGDYLSQKEKLERITKFQSIAGIGDVEGWLEITPDEHGDWVKQRDDRFTQFISLGDKKDKSSATIFANYSSGIKTNRDAWCYNASRSNLHTTMSGMIAVYQGDLLRYKLACDGLNKEFWPDVVNYSTTDPAKISWNRGLMNDLSRQQSRDFKAAAITTGLYRPFTKQWVYFDKHLNDMVYQIPRIFPNETAGNRVICMNGVGAQKEFSVLISNAVPDLHVMQTGQCFPLYLYEVPTEKKEEGDTPQGDILAGIDEQDVESNTQGYTKKEAITDEGLAHFHAAYPNQSISKEDVFYYVYGLLHSPDYRECYADNLSKELPRIPCVKTYADFQAFSQAGRDLAELHLNYETVAMYPAQIAGGSLLLKDSDYRVEKMKYGKTGKDKDLTTLIYNDKITVTGIPLEAYEYVVNGKPALDWVVERQCVSTHKDSGIVNDANDWAIETMQNPKYPLELFLRVVTVSLETMKIVNALPALNI
jgi:predicted helicase